MDRSIVPPGLRALLQSATRTHQASLGSPAISGPQAMAAVTGVSVALVSKWGSDDYGEKPSIEAAALVEAKSGVPAYAEVFASLTGHRLEPIAGAESEASAPNPHEFAAVAFAAVAKLHEIWADGRVHVGEAKAALLAIDALAAGLAELRRDLSERAEG